MKSPPKEFLRSFSKQFKKQRTLETGFTMLEAVVVVGVLLALAAGGFLAYGPITDNAKTAAARTAASSVYTAILVAQSDGDPSTSATDVVDDYNASNTKLKAEIREAGTEAAVAAMTTAGYTPKSDNDFCLRVTNLEKPSVFAEMGNCKVEAIPVAPTPTPSPTATATPTPTVTPEPEPTPDPTPTETPAPVVPVSYGAAWGANSQGQYGAGAVTSSYYPFNSMSTGPLEGKAIDSMTTGDGFTCALSEGAVFCSGRNDQGQLGNGTTSTSLNPVAVTASGVLSGKTITAIDAGRYHVCAIADGKAYCWGYNVVGQLGTGSTARSTVPVAVNAAGVLSGKVITAISSHGEHTCALAAGKAYCWGDNTNGQLGNGNKTNSSNPVTVISTGVLANKTISSLSIGYGHSCALAEGKVYCWGSNTYGQLGNGNTVESTSPVAVSTTGVLSGKTITSIGSGYYQNCALAEGKAYCWGYNSNGQIGNGSTANQLTPVAVSGVLSGKNVTSVAGGGFHTCAVADGKAYCWGSNNGGMLGNGNTAAQFTPVAVSTTGLLQDKTIVSLDMNLNFTTAMYK